MTQQQNKNLSSEQKKRLRIVFNSYAFIVIPFLIIAFIKVYQLGVFEGAKALFMLSDWSLISFVIFSQSMCTYLTLLGEKKEFDAPYMVTVFLRYIVCGLLPAAATVWIINVEETPPTPIYFIQAAVFIYASYRFIIDNLNAQVLAKK
ncbi:hypothetical protein VHTUMSATKI_41570 [Vibrio harveyi]|uniref:hypothetical protein n=1 Tax=Vibrio TaxID=662 RepID=UPI000841C3CB|nr:MULTISPECIES: hypothetical protein [Vibrio]MDK9773436.1 hypothetical protein [Vibrio sp. B181a]ODM56413.1 hypothetical protein BC455_21660 [Vibrio harveyi]HDM8129096.1 hypothetical protein [Vibrio harveyi]